MAIMVIIYALIAIGAIAAVIIFGAAFYCLIAAFGMLLVRSYRKQ